MSTILITGGGRGLGFELAKQLLAFPESSISTIFITTRGPPSSGLQDLIDLSKGRAVHIIVEATSHSSVQRAAANIESVLGARGLDILVNNVGVCVVRRTLKQQYFISG